MFACIDLGIGVVKLVFDIHGSLSLSFICACLLTYCNLLLYDKQMCSCAVDFDRLWSSMWYFSVVKSLLYTKQREKLRKEITFEFRLHRNVYSQYITYILNDIIGNQYNFAINTLLLCYNCFFRSCLLNNFLIHSHIYIERMRNNCVNNKQRMEKLNTENYIKLDIWTTSTEAFHTTLLTNIQFVDSLEYVYTLNLT